jgi:hypothetical protein
MEDLMGGRPEFLLLGMRTETSAGEADRLDLVQVDAGV